MEETTTTDSTAIEPSGVKEINGIPIDENGMAIPDTQLEDVVEEAGSQPTDTQQGEDVDSTDTVEETTEASPDDEVTEWAKKKNLPLDDPIKMAKMVRESEQKMHQATEQTKLKEALPKPEVDEFDQYAQLSNEIQQLKMATRVNDFYSSNPEARAYDSQMAALVQEDPALAGNLKAVYALARFNELSDSSTDLKQQGGREALTKLAQKQQATAIKGNAVSPEMGSSNAITPANVDRLVATHDDKWFKDNYDAINKAMAS